MKKTDRDFKGVWIPKRIWLDKSLTLVEKCLLVEIDSLDNDEAKGCFAKNDHLAEFVSLSEKRVQNILTDLKKKGYLTQVFFDGRNRGLRVCYPENGRAAIPNMREQLSRKRDEAIPETGEQNPQNRDTTPIYSISNTSSNTDSNTIDDDAHEEKTIVLPSKKTGEALENIPPSSASPPLSAKQVIDDYHGRMVNDPDLISAATEEGIPPERYHEALGSFIIKRRGVARMPESEDDFRQHFLNWIGKKKQHQSQNLQSYGKQTHAGYEKPEFNERVQSGLEYFAQMRTIHSGE